MTHFYRLAVPGLALLVGVGLARPAQAAERVPFKGIVYARVLNPDAVPDQNGILTLHLAISGQATHLGRLSGAGIVQQSLVTGAATAQVQWYSANGRDSVLLEGTAQLFPTADGCVFAASQSADVVGGTGRFAGAEGHIDMGGSVNLCTLQAIHPFEGTISRPNSR